MPGASRSSSARQVPPGHAALAVGRVALVGDGLEVEQVGGGLRHQPDRARTAAGRAASAGSMPSTVDGARPRRGAAALQGPQQRRLARAVAAHQRRDLAGAQVEVDPAQRASRRGVAHHGAAAVATHASPVARRVRTGGRGRRARSRSGAAGRRASRTVSGSGDQPASRPSSTIGGATGESASTSAGGPDAHRRRRRRAARSGRRTAPPARAGARPSAPSAPRSCTSRVQRGQHLLGGRSGRAPRSARRAPAPAGAWSAPSRWRPAAAAPPDSVRRSRARRSAMPSRSRVSSTRLRIVVGRQAELLHAVGELLLDGVGDEAGERVLADVPDQVGAARAAGGRGCRGRRRRRRRSGCRR